MTNVVAKHLGVFFFSFFSLKLLFFTFFKTRGDPFISYGTRIYRYNKSSIGNVPSNIVCAKNKKEETTYNGNHYLSLSKILIFV